MFRFSGLTRLLRAACYRNYSFKRARRLAGAIPAALRRETGLTRPWHGRARGRAGHEQLRVAVNAGERALHDLYEGRERLVLTDELLRSLASMHLQPVTAEFIDYYDEARIATGIDLLCMTTAESHYGANLLVPCEVKFGGDNHFLESSGPLKAPPELAARYNNSPLNQAYLQLAFCRQMLIDHYPTARLGPSYVVQVRQVDTVYHRLPADIAAAGPSIRDLVFAARARVNVRRRRARRE